MRQILQDLRTGKTVLEEIPAPRVRPGHLLITTTRTLVSSHGSIGTIRYLANGHRSFPKERLEVFCAGRILQLDNFRTLRAWGWRRLSRQRLWRQNKGQSACSQAFVDAVRGVAPTPIAVDEVFEVATLTLDVSDRLRGLA